MHRVASTDGIEIVVHELGGSGPALLLAHATGLHGRCWAPVARHLSGRRCLAPDLRGHGDSVAPADHEFDWEGFADDVLAVVDALGPGALDGAGHSKGGAALLLAEQRRPGTFRALWCYEPVVFPPDFASSGPNPLAAGARRRRATFPSLRAAIENFGSKPPFEAIAQESLRAYVDGGFTRQPDGTVTLKCRPEHEARVYEMGARHEAFDRLGRVRCPVTVARGRVEPGPAAFADAIAARLPNGHLETHEHLGHFGPLEAPAEIADAIDRALGDATG